MTDETSFEDHVSVDEVLLQGGADNSDGVPVVVYLSGFRDAETVEDG